MAMKRTILTAREREAVASAIREAESRTDGEVYCVLAHSSDSYFFPAAFIVGLAMLAASVLVSAALHLWWYDIGVVTFVAAQLAAYGSALLLLWAVPALRLACVPRRLRYRRAHDQARSQFLARNIHMTDRRTGVLIFVSLAERYAEIVADAGINAHVEQDRWDETVALLVDRAGKGRVADGFVEAVSMVGALLARHVPATAGKPNELDDHLAEI